MRKYPGFEKVDAYLIPKKEAGNYKRRRKLARKAAIKAMETFCDHVYCDFAGSQDGEAVLGMKDGECIAFIHLDPWGIDRIEKAQSEGRLVEVLKEDKEA